MEKSRYKSFTYEITTDPEFMAEYYSVPPELREQQEALYVEIMEKKTGKKPIRKLLELIGKYPENPQLKNYLSIAYTNAGNPTKAQEVNRRLLAEHPAYLFGKLNLAAEYYKDGEFEKMPEVLGAEMEIQSLYPHRNKFHLSEVTSFNKMAFLYFIATDNLEAARARLEIMKEIAPDHPDTEFVILKLLQARMKEEIDRWEEEEKTKIHVTPLPNTVPIQITDPPVFENEIIYRLYENGLYIQNELLQEILELPHESLIADLNKIVNDLLCRYEFFSNIVEENGWQEEKMGFPMHAIMLLGELRAEDSLPKVLEVLRQDKEFLSFWFDDHLTETLWEPLYYLGNQQLEVLINFVQEPGLDTYSKTAVTTAVNQIPYHQPERKEEVMRWYARVFDFFANSVPEDNVIDSDLIGLLIWEVTDLGYKELLPDIKNLYDKKYVSESICGEYADIEKDIAEPALLSLHKELLSIKQRYEAITTTWSGYNVEDEFEDDDEDDYFDDYEYLPPTEPARTSPKIGRNEPCPCGSGKKYKKCCLNIKL